METLAITHEYGHSKYQLISDNGDLPIAYHINTPRKVIDVLERCRKSRTRIKLRTGDIDTGRDWNEENNITGYIGLSRGYKARFPILVHNERSMGGGGLSDDTILKITESKTGKVLYQADNYQERSITIVDGDKPEYPFNVNIDGKLHGRCKTIIQAKRLVSKLS